MFIPLRREFGGGRRRPGASGLHLFLAHNGWTSLNKAKRLEKLAKG
jgi:hypothetical protein